MVIDFRVLQKGKIADTPWSNGDKNVAKGSAMYGIEDCQTQAAVFVFARCDRLKMNEVVIQS